VENYGYTAGRRRRARKDFWLKILLAGTVMYIATLKVLQYTGNPHLVTTLVFVGNFLVPVSFVSFFYERRGIFSVSMTATALCFIYGGILGTITAALIEPFFITSLTFSSSFIVGLIEELAKIIGVVIIARRRHYNSYKDGIILGAAAGMGFAAFESTGYAFSAFLQTGGSLSYTVLITLLRGITAPVGHGTWTAIFSGILLNESVAGKFYINHKVIYAYLTVSVLHGLWNGIPQVIDNFIPSPNADMIGLATIGAIGIIILYRQWRKAEKEFVPMIK
jgi:RsiW-degrading membrane proteinase PrsW (M82 family)